MLKAKCCLEIGPCEATSCFETQTYVWDDCRFTYMICWFLMLKVNVGKYKMLYVGEDKTSWGGCPDVDWSSSSNRGTPVMQKVDIVGSTKLSSWNQWQNFDLTRKISWSTPPLKLRVTLNHKHLFSFDAWTLGVHCMGSFLRASFPNAQSLSYTR